MSWGAVAGAAIGVVGSQLGKDKNGGAGTTTASKEPWAAAAPWLQQNLDQGQALQRQYQNQPFNQQQQQAFANQYAQSDYMRSLVPSLLGQIQGQQLGFDPANPTARPKAFTWDAAGGLLGGGGNMSAANAADAAARAAKPAETSSGWSWDGQFHSQDDVLSGLNMVGHDSAGNLVGKGGFGSWQYGAGAVPGTAAYRDMNEYFLRGGADPNNVRARLNSSMSNWANYVPMGFNTTDGTGEAGGGPGTSGNW